MEGHCGVCSLPVSNYPNCFQCNQHLNSRLPLANRVGSLIYAVEPDSQAYKTVRNYKGAHPGPGLVQTMRQLLAVGLRGHSRCLLAISGIPDLAWAVVPSRQQRTVLRDIVVGFSKNPAREVGISPVGVPPVRELRPGAWNVAGAVGRHVLVVDDSWVTGASSQSVASALKSKGAEQVSILTVARVLKPTLPEIKKFVDHDLPRLTYDWRRCPWTFSGECPEQDIAI